MKITNVQIFPYNGKGKMKAYAQVTIDSKFVINGITIHDGEFGFYIMMPKSQGDFFWYDVCHPITSDFRRYLSETILDEFNKTGG